MAYQPHTLVTMGGRNKEITAYDEIWQIGFRGFNVPDGHTPMDPSQFENYVTQMAVPLATWWGSTKAHNANTAYLDWVKVVNIGADGTYSSDPYIGEVELGPGPATPLLPAFCCIVNSWTTDRRAGKARFGRVYPPNYGAPLDTGSSISSSVASDMCDAAGALLTAVSDSGDEFNFVPYVVSRSGVSNPITGVRVGNVIDVQRRRKNAVPETYIDASWSPS